jgi:hypothetical protein
MSPSPINAEAATPPENPKANPTPHPPQGSPLSSSIKGKRQLKKKPQLPSAFLSHVNGQSPFFNAIPWY